MSTITRRNNPVSSIGNTDSYILMGFVGYGFISQYLLLSIIAGISFVIIFRNLWKPYFPPVLLFFMSFHWIQVFASIIHADVSGMTIDELYGSKNSEFLFLMTFAQITVMSLVMNSFLESKRFKAGFSFLKDAAQKLNTRNVIIGYFLSMTVLPVIVSFSYGSASLYQLVLSLRIIKVAFSALLFFILLLKNTPNRLLIISMLLFDFILSFASFFSDFKTILLMLMIVYFTVHPHLKKGAFVRMLPIALGMFVFFSFWSAVKGSYRLYLNQGTSQQVKAVDNTEALSFIFQKAAAADFGTLREGAEIFLSRIQYMERYSEVHKNVPEVIPHQDGNDLLKTVEFLLVPRFINENKGVKDASLRTSYYTGKNFSKASQGTSISMGYFCDMFIDFGLFVMFVPLALIAVLIGGVYKRILQAKGYNILFTYSILVGTFLSLGTFESDNLFFLGILRNNVVLLLLGYFAFFPFLNRFIQAK